MHTDTCTMWIRAHGCARSRLNHSYVTGRFYGFEYQWNWWLSYLVMHASMYMYNTLSSSIQMNRTRKDSFFWRCWYLCGLVLARMWPFWLWSLNEFIHKLSVECYQRQQCQWNSSNSTRDTHTHHFGSLHGQIRHVVWKMQKNCNNGSENWVLFWDIRLHH